MTDLAGARVVCAYESELAKVAEVVEYASTSTNCATSALTGWVTTARHLL
jgi:ppGpp synthetase/RelA/SpoT-type nucleotidyltranferase